MSDSRSPGAVPPARLNLEQQKKRAKELLRAHRRGEPEARDRVERIHAGLCAPLKLADAQYVVARENGFDDWARLKLHATQSRSNREQLLTAALGAALHGHDEAVHSALTLSPDLETQSLHLACALASESGVAALLERSAPQLALRAGPLQGSPLAYLCFSRFARGRDDVRRARARIAGALIDAGANPNECIDTHETPGGKLSVLAAAARHTLSAELVGELLARGAVLEPEGSTAGPPAPPLVSAALGGSLACVQRLLAAGAPRWQAREALEVAIENDAPEMAQALLEHGCLPDHAGRWQGRGGGALHAALGAGRDVRFIELLIAGGATVMARDRDGRSPLAVAVQLHETEAAALFRKHGATDDELTPADRLIGACFARDATLIESLLRTEPELAKRCAPSDRPCACRAVRRNDSEALLGLLRAGFEPNAVDDDGDTALHVAVRRQALSCVEHLLAYGASPDLANYENLSPRQLALAAQDAEVRALLLTRLGGSGAELLGVQHQTLAQALDSAFERALEVMSEGDTKALGELLDRTPGLAAARSQRYHRATLLHYLGNNGTERRVAPEQTSAIADLLLTRGAVVDASCRMYGGGPYQTTLGLAVTTDPSQYPSGEFVRLLQVLLQHGAKVHESDGRSRALEGAIEYGARVALQVLADHGAHAYDLSTAAALGELRTLDVHLTTATEAMRVAALENAAGFGRIDVLERVLATGVDIDAQGVYGGTALHKAAASNCVDAVRWLLTHGANPAVRDRENRATPADWARFFGHTAALAALEAVGTP